MQYYYYQNPDSPEQIKRKFVEAVKKHYSEKIDSEFLAYIKKPENLNITTIICESIEVEVDFRLSMDCTIEHKVYEVTGYEVKSNSGSLDVSEKRNYYTTSSIGFWYDNFYNRLKEIGEKGRPYDSWGTNKLEIYSEFTPSNEITPAMRKKLVSEENLVSEFRLLQASYKKELSEHATIKNPKIKEVDLKRVYEEEATVYIYPKYEISFSYKGKGYFVYYDRYEYAFEKNLSRCDFPLKETYKKEKLEKIDIALKKFLKVVRLYPLSFFVSLVFSSLFYASAIIVTRANDSVASNTISGIVTILICFSFWGIIGITIMKWVDGVTLLDALPGTINWYKEKAEEFKAEMKKNKEPDLEYFKKEAKSYYLPIAINILILVVAMASCIVALALT